MKFIWIISIPLLIMSCQKKVYDAKTCEDLSIKAFKGWPKAANEFNQNCGNVKVVFTAKKCQQVLNRYIMYGDTERIKAEFGVKALECLTKNDLEKFKKSDVEADNDNHGGNKSNSNN